MDTLTEPYVEKLQTGAIVIISGEYMPVDKMDQNAQEESLFLTFGETIPDMGNEIDWKLLEAFDFAS